MWEEVVESTRSLHVAGDIDDSQVFADSYLTWPTVRDQSNHISEGSAPTGLQYETSPTISVMGLLPELVSSTRPVQPYQ
ncbi:unnamed protein product [Arctogadus glacialis]